VTAAMNVAGDLDTAGGCYGIDGPDPDDIERPPLDRAGRQAITGWTEQHDAAAVAITGGATDRAESVDWLLALGLIDKATAAASQLAADRRAGEQWASEHGYLREVTG